MGLTNDLKFYKELAKEKYITNFFDGITCNVYVSTFCISTLIWQVKLSFLNLVPVYSSICIPLPSWIGCILLHMSNTFLNVSLLKFSALLSLFFYLDSIHARLNSHYEAWSYKTRSTKRLKHTGNLFRKNLQIKGVC